MKTFNNGTEMDNKLIGFIAFEELNLKVFLKIFKTETNLLTNTTCLVQHLNFK